MVRFASRVKRNVRARKYRKYRLGRQVRRRAMYQSQVFTETFKANTKALTCPGIDASGQITLAASTINTVGKFIIKMSDIPQMPQYAALYQLYKILKVTAIVIPKWTSEDPNVAAQNGSSSVAAYEQGRFVYAVNDDPNDIAPPASELEVLQDNGAKIRRMASALKIHFRPRPAIDSTDPINNALVPVLTPQKPWLGFGDTTGGGDMPIHVGVDWSWCQGANANTTNLFVADVQFKVTFACKDPR